jgi:hypothetical protein
VDGVGLGLLRGLRDGDGFGLGARLGDVEGVGDADSGMAGPSHIRKSLNTAA